ncbi:glycosyltransferase family 4 protein [Belnapia sp. T6]|uniref:Glycosyltransferase family 4 protein n=1 Tax=Belnapia mucosa TaxID=2804532 RepID=A0ABS1VCI6_9PROT|nr:glycosyltransferase family 1 protein [Belnapia mucosa]MBL6459327.1 glycosyltransferase family 4 protein [Belnapia mucosa]
MAYAKHWLAEPAGACSFVAQSPWGWFGLVARDTARALVEALDQTWTEGTSPPSALHRARRIAAALQGQLTLGTGRAALRAVLAAHRRTIFLLVSHRSLERAAPIAALRRAGARFVPLIHDLIPLTHPEYSRPRQIACHAARVATTAAEADGIIVNSAATAATLWPYLAQHGRALPPLMVAPLGVDLPPPPPALLPSEPYFVCLGTIEPRKNHLLLLHAWRDLAAQARTQPGMTVPRLLLLGRRGWENENVVDLLERCDLLREPVREVGTPPDRQVAELIAGATALLYPSFVEGYGLPVAEALGLGVPVICSGDAALREVGGAVPDYLDPTDGPAWRRLVAAYAAPGSPERAAQLDRLRHWTTPRWSEHFEQVDILLEQVAGATRPAARPVPAPQPVRVPSLA